MVEKYFAKVFGVECTGEMNWNCSVGEIWEKSEKLGKIRKIQGASSEILECEILLVLPVKSYKLTAVHKQKLQSLESFMFSWPFSPRQMIPIDDLMNLVI